MNEDLIYLAIPYTWNPGKSFDIANEVAAELMESGDVIFSPVSHGHSIAYYIDDDEKRTSFEFWMGIDIPILLKCKYLILVVVGDNGEQLIKNSKGCQREIDTAKKNGIKIIRYHYNKFYDYNDLSNNLKAEEHEN